MRPFSTNISLNKISYILAVIWISLLTVSFSTSSALAVTPEIVSPSTIVTGTAKNFPPYYLTDESGRPGGFAVEVFNEVAKRAGIKVKYKVLNDGRALQRALRSGEIHVIPNISISEKRKKDFIFTRPASTIRMSLFLRAKTEGVKSIEDLVGKPIGGTSNSLSMRLLARKKHKKIKGYSNLSSGVIGLLSGEIDAFVFPEAVFWKRIRELRIADKVDAAEIPIAQSKRAMMFSKQNTELRDRLDSVLGEFLETERYQQIYLKWFGTPIPFWSPLRISTIMGLVLIFVMIGMGLWRYRSVAKLNKDLRSSEDRFRELIDKANYGILVHRHYQPLYANAALAGMYGYNSVEDIMALPSTKVLTDDKSHNSSHESRLKNDPISTDQETIGVRKKGALIWEQRRSFIIGWEGKPAVCSIRSDISERIKLDNMKSEFISTVSHELRTPLTSIKGSLGLVVNGGLGKLPDTMVGMLDIAYRNTNRLIDLVNDILDMEKLNSESMNFELIDQNLATLVIDSVESNRGFASQNKSEFILTDIDSNLTIKGDAGRLTQVIANLLSNAAKFSPDDSPVEISVTREGNLGVVSVTDYGAGIPDDLKEHIFGRFTQVDSSDTREKGGTGLGLNISQSIIKKHNGIIGLVSDQDVGSTFFFKLPLATE
jgi:PAS domain S-box-containing protein